LAPNSQRGDAAVQTVVQQRYPEKLSFSDLRVPTGMPLTLDLAAPARREQVRLIGVEKDTALIVSLPEKALKDLLNEGSLLKARFLLKTGFVNFGVRVLALVSEPFPHMFLSYPSMIEMRKVRSAERVTTRIMANIDSHFNIDATWPKDGIIEDLSKTGAKIRSRDRLGEFGHELLLEFDLVLPDMTRNVRLSAIIRNAHVESEVVGEPHFVFGVQFLEMSEDARLTLNNFIYEQR